MLRVSVIALLAIVLCGCGGGVRRKIENGIARAMPEKIGRAKSYTVKVSGSTPAMIRGRMSGVEITGEEVRLAKGFTVARLDVSLKDLVVDTHTQEIKRCASAGYSATVSEGELGRYLAKRYRDIPGLEVTLARDCAHVVANPGLAGVTVTVSADAALKVIKGRKLALEIIRIDVAGLPTPGFAREFIEGRINPIFDAADLGFDAKIDSVRIDPGSLTITGTLDVAQSKVGESIVDSR